MIWEPAKEKMCPIDFLAGYLGVILMRVSIACCTSCSISTSWYDGTCHDMIVHIACSMYLVVRWYTLRAVRHGRMLHVMVR